MPKERSLPKWILRDLEHVIEAYYSLLPKLAERCTVIAASDRKDDRGRRCDDYGTITHYRLDAKYCAGQVVRMVQIFRESLDAKQWEVHRFSAWPKNAKLLATWAWEHPWVEDEKPATVVVETMAWKDFYLKFTERERRALVYTIGGGMSHKDAAQKMGITVKTLRNTIFNARHKFGPDLDFLKQSKKRS